VRSDDSWRRALRYPPVGAGLAGFLAWLAPALADRDLFFQDLQVFSAGASPQLVGRTEQVAVGAAGCVRKVPFSVLMAGQTGIAQGARRLLMRPMTANAALMLLHDVQTRQRRLLMTARAVRRPGDARRPVRSMAARAAPLELAVRAVRLFAMAARAVCLVRRARVRRVALRARLVPCRCRAMLRLVTGAAGRRDGAGMRLVTARALGVTARDLGVGRRVAVRAASGERGRPVRQTTVTALAGLVTRLGGHPREHRAVAALAGSMVGVTANEVVGRMALYAGYAAVKGLFVRSALVTVATSARCLLRLTARRVRVVTPDTAPRLAVFRVVGTLVAMALGASLISPGLHVVCSVAVRALIVRGDRAGAQHPDVSVAGAASNGSRSFEIVRPVAADAFAVSGVEQRRRWHDGIAGMALDTARASVRGGCVLVLMARGAGVGLRAVPAVCGRNVVTARTRRGRRRRLLVRLVTGDAVLGFVHSNGRNAALILGMAACAVTRFEVLVERTSLRARSGLDTESVTARAVAARLGSEAEPCRVRGVNERRLFVVTGGAALGCRCSQRRLGELVTVRTRYFLLDHVHGVPPRLPRFLPGLLHVHAATGRVAAMRVAFGAGGEGGGNRRQRQPCRLQRWFHARHWRGII